MFETLYAAVKLHAELSSRLPRLGDVARIEAAEYVAPHSCGTDDLISESFSGTVVMPLTANREQEVLAPGPAASPVDELALALAAIRADSVASSESYLRDTVVPHGGE